MSLGRYWDLEKLDRIELFDNAHLFGTYNVSGMVVFIDGSPAKNEYRKFKISVDKMMIMGLCERLFIEDILGF